MARGRTPSRRKFIRNLGVGTLAASAGVSLPVAAAPTPPQLGRSVAVSFDHGVASGDPLAHRVIIWTRATPERRSAFSVNWQVALDADFRRIIRSGSTATGPARDYTVKVDVAGLPADRVLYYRFYSGRSVSPVGRTRTLPLGDVAEVKLAVFSCSNYPAGYFHVYAEAAKLDDVHAAVHLGDYIYEYERGGYASEDAAALGREVLPAGELLTLDDYRARYAQYRTDPDLQRFHAALPMIAVWDDHEIANDTYKDGAENHDPATEGDFAIRRAAAIQAYYEWMPIRLVQLGQSERIYRSFNFGNLLALHMLDTRALARDLQLSYGNYFGADGSFDSVRFTADLSDPNRQLIGGEQTLWLQDQMAVSNATWQLLGQQVLIGRMNIPAPLVLGTVSFSTYSALVVKAQTAPQTLTPEELAILSQPAIPYNLDAWDGYAVARETVFGIARALDKNLVVLAGDTHNAWASDLADVYGNRIGVEFACASVSSPGLEEYFPSEDPAAVAAGLTQIIGPLQYANTGDRGFLLVTASADECRAEWRYVSTVKQAEYSTWTEGPLRTLPGADGRVLEAV